MQYLGGKFRIAKQIAALINSYKPQVYIEPFVGGCNIAPLVTAPARRASDVDGDLIEMYQALQNGWTPPENVTEADYTAAMTGGFDAPTRAFIAYGCSFSGKKWGGYARSGSRNYASNARNACLKLAPKIKGVSFSAHDYKKTIIESGSPVIYCDPPYAGTTGYKDAPFDSAAFWETMREWRRWAVVLVSEYNAPADFRCLAEFKTKTDMHTKSGKEPRIERVFV